MVCVYLAKVRFYWSWRQKNVTFPIPRNKNFSIFAARFLKNVQKQHVIRLKNVRKQHIQH